MPKIVDHDRYREELMRECVDIFCRRGYNNVTMREIAGELGVSTGTLYHYFPTKEDMFEKIFEYLRETDVRTILDQIGDDFSIDDMLRIYGEHWTDQRDYYQNVILLAIDFYRNNEREEVHRVLKEYSGFYRETIRDNLGVRGSLAHMIFIHMIGLLYHDLLIRDTEFFSEQLELFIDMTMAYIEKHYPGTGTGMNSAGTPGG